MSTFCDYIRWYGAYGFDRIPLGKEDALILCAMTYFDMPEGPETLTVREMLPLYEQGECRLMIPDLDGSYTQVFRLAADSKRYGDLQLIRREEHFSEDPPVQFSAVTYRAPGLFDFAAFRGTDMTIAGWKEDFMLSFTLTSAQKMALEYVRNGIGQAPAYYIGGHSKGGNLALYAACLLTQEERGHLKRLYLLDSPGLCGEVMDEEKVRGVDAVTTMVVPEFSVVGQLFSPGFSDTHIVKSSARALLQHIATSWQITDGRMEEAQQREARSVFLGETMERWISKVSPPERRAFTEELFGALEADGAVTLADLMKDGSDGIDALAERLVNVSPDVKKTAAELPTQALFDGLAEKLHVDRFLNRMLENELIVGCIMVMCGIIAIVASDKILEIISVFTVASLALTELAVTVNRLRRNGWNFRRVKERIFIFIGLVVTLAVLLFKEHAMFLFGSILFSILFLVLAYVTGIRAFSKKYTGFRRILMMAETVFCATIGIILLFVGQDKLFQYALAVGIALIAGGVLRLGDVAVRTLADAWRTRGERKREKNDI